MLQVVESHECELVSECCGAIAIGETDRCSFCRENAGFYCYCTVCPECNEVRIDDARVQAGMKCGVCAYA